MDYSRNYPRVHAICCGMILPLWFLILLSLLFGSFLAKLESPGEIESNNAYLRRQAIVGNYLEIVGATIEKLPKICFGLFLLFQTNNQTYNNYTYTEEETTASAGADMFKFYLETGEERFAALYAANVLLLTTTYDLNVTEFGIFTLACGDSARQFTNGIQQRWTKELESVSSQTSFSFHWNRCSAYDDEETTEERNKFRFMPSQAQIIASRPLEQAKHYARIWQERQIELEAKYLEQLLKEEEEQQLGVVAARITAFEMSLQDATAADKCNSNASGAAWFWFTIMTTVGYGNQSPTSLGGRWMVYTLGFASILAFGGILASAGSVMVVIVDDLLIRCSGRHNTKLGKKTKTFVWGALWYIWMCVIAVYTRAWWKRRMGDQVEIKDAYWFAFISTTTVGLGDYYLPPGILFVADLLMFTLLFLFGFVLLSAFLGEFAGLVGEYFPDAGTKLRTRLETARRRRQEGSTRQVLAEEKEEEGDGNDDGTENAEASSLKVEYATSQAPSVTPSHA
jgi:hypothetical protein